MAILDEVDPDRARAEPGELCFGTVDSWVAWTLSGGAASGRRAPRHRRHQRRRDRAGRPRHHRLGRAVARAPEDPAGHDADRSSTPPGSIGAATALPGAPPICGMAGDQQASLVGQGCTLPGLAKATFGTGGMLDQCTGSGTGPGSAAARGDAGTFPIVAFRVGGTGHLGHRGGHALRRHLRRVAARRPRHPGVGPRVGSRRRCSARHPATSGSSRRCSGLGTPVWDFGARGTLVGLTRGSGRPEIVRAVLEGVAHRGADLVEASESRQRLCHRVAAHRRRHVGERRLRRSSGRCHRPSGGDLTRPRGHHARRRPPGRPGHRRLRLDRRAGEHVHAPPHGRARRDDATRSLGAASAGWRPGPRPRPPSPSSRASPSSSGIAPAERKSPSPERPPPGSDLPDVAPGSADATGRPRPWPHPSGARRLRTPFPG